MKVKFHKDNFCTIRTEKGLSVEEIATKVGVSIPTVRSWEAGRRNPKPEAIHKMASLLNTSIAKISNLNNDRGSSNIIEESFDNYSEGIHNILMSKQKKLLENLVDINYNINLMSSAFECITNYTKAIVYIKNNLQEYIYANANFFKMLGLPLDYNINGKKDKDILSSFDLLSNTREDLYILKTKFEVFREGFLLGSRKKEFATYIKSPIIKKDGKCNGIIAIIFKKEFDDFTKNIAMMQISQGVKNLYKNVFILDKNFRIFRTYPFTTTIYDFDSEFLRQSKMFWIDNCILPDDREKLLKILKAVLSTQQSITHEYRIINIEGEIEKKKTIFTFSEYVDIPYILCLENDN